MVYLEMTSVLAGEPSILWVKFPKTMLSQDRSINPIRLMFNIPNMWFQVHLNHGFWLVFNMNDVFLEEFPHFAPHFHTPYSAPCPTSRRVFLAAPCTAT